MPIKLKEMVESGEIRIGLGMRNIKTAAAVLFCLLVYELIYAAAGLLGFTMGHMLPVQACTAAVICMQNTVKQTLSNGIVRIIGTFYGGVFGILVLFIMTYAPAAIEFFIIALAISLCICLCNLTGQQNACAISCVVLLSMLFNTEEESQYISALFRLIETIVGIIVAGLVNQYFFIPKWMKSLWGCLIGRFKKKAKGRKPDTVLVENLRLGECKNILIFNKPESFRDFDGLIFDTAGGKEPYDCIFLFVFSYEDMERSIEEIYRKGLVMDGGSLYLAYPKECFLFDIADDDFYKSTTFKKTHFSEADQYFVIGFLNQAA